MKENRKNGGSRNLFRVASFQYVSAGALVRIREGESPMSGEGSREGESKFEKEREKAGRSKSGFLVVWFCCLKPEENRSAEESGGGMVGRKGY